MKTIIIFLTALFLTITVNSQTLIGSITVQTKSSSTFYYTACEKVDAYYYSLGTTGIPVYTKNLTKYKVIGSSISWANYNFNTLKYMSDHLFNTDDKLEFLVKGNDGNYYVLNEDMVILKTITGVLSEYGGAININNKARIAFSATIPNSTDIEYKMYELSGIYTPVNAIKGTQGIQGERGLQGIQGIQGVAGKDGVCTTPTSYSTVNTNTTKLVYPNPATDIVNVNNVNNEQIMLLNAQGVLVGNLGSIKTFSALKYPVGVYFVKVGDVFEKLIIK